MLNAVRLRKQTTPLGHSEKNCRLTGGIFAWESVFSTEKRIATSVCGLVRNDSVLLTERH